MFFVGASAHMFIYLLIPTFLVVCCYFKGTVGSLGDFLSVSVAYEQKTVEYSKDTCVYKEEIIEEDKQQKTIALVWSTTDIHLTSYHCSFNPSPTIQSADLRGPPSLLV